MHVLSRTIENGTLWSELFLFGMSDVPEIQPLLFLLFLGIYFLTVMGNLLIVLLIVTDSHLHTPMFFFLGNLASLDVCFTTLTTPRMLFDLHTSHGMISIPACITQVFFFIYFATCEILLLAVMSYDRYNAICRPLHYVLVMHWKMCVHLAVGVWTFGMTYSLTHTLFTLRLSFCHTNIVQSFFCDVSKLLQISCTDPFINMVSVFLLGGLLGLGSLLMTFIPYVAIFSTVLKMKAKEHRVKAFTTCSSHLTVVFVFYGTLIFNYFRPPTSYHPTADRLVSVFYTVITPLLNPLIYSLRNHEIKAALNRFWKVYDIC